MLRNLRNVFLGFYLKADSATVSPPLSTVLGNEGLKTKQFCDDFNNLTKDLPDFLILQSFVSIDKSNRSWKLVLGQTPSGKIMRLISFKITTYYLSSGGRRRKEIKGLTLTQIALLGFFFFGVFSWTNVKILLGTAKSLGLLIICGER